MLPAAVGVLILVSSMVMAVEPERELPPDLVTVITCPDTATDSDPSKLVPSPPMAVVPPLLMAKPVGRVITILPSAANVFSKVRATSTSPTAPAIRLSGSTLVPVNVPIITMVNAGEVSTVVLESEDWVNRRTLLVPAELMDRPE